MSTPISQIKAFPEDGNYREQKEFVESLPRGSDATIHKALETIKENLMETQPRELPDGIQADLFRHSKRTGGLSGDSSETELPSYSIVKKEFVSQKPGCMETHTAFFDESNQVLKYCIGPDGIPKIYRIANKQFAQISQGVESDSATCFTIRAKYKDGFNSQCKTTFYSTKEL